jgi:hypothetical protein
VRLNEAEYDGGEFERRGIRHVDLCFEDCTAPPRSVVDEFLRVAAGARGVVAVHCKAGLGRTGTLIAVYMMEHHGFTGREAMGWLRIMRPGSVIGEQQQFVSGWGAGAGGGSDVADARRGMRRWGSEPELLALQVAAGMERRGSERSLAAMAADGGSESSDGDGDAHVGDLLEC